MADWVTNKLFINGKDSNKVLMTLLGFDLDTYQRFVDFDKIIPMPKDLEISRSSFSEYGLMLSNTRRNPDCKYYGKNKMTKSEYQNWITSIYKDPSASFLANVVLKESDIKWLKGKYTQEMFELLEDIGEKQVENLEKYGYRDRDSWMSANWDCKSNAANTFDVGYNYVGFKTPWNPPFAVIKQMSKLNPGVKFELRYAGEEPGINCGKYYCENGDGLLVPFKNLSEKAYELSFQLNGGKEEYSYDPEVCNYVKKEMEAVL